MTGPGDDLVVLIKPRRLKDDERVFEEGYIHNSVFDKSSETWQNIHKNVVDRWSTNTVKIRLCGNQSFEAAPFRGKLMLFRQRFPDARRGGAERVRLVRAGAESVTTRPT